MTRVMCSRGQSCPSNLCAQRCERWARHAARSLTFASGTSVMSIICMFIPPWPTTLQTFPRITTCRGSQILRLVHLRCDTLLLLRPGTPINGTSMLACICYSSVVQQYCHTMHDAQRCHVLRIQPCHAYFRCLLSGTCSCKSPVHTNADSQMADVCAAYTLQS